jgi:hypothetical protein
MIATTVAVAACGVEPAGDAPTDHTGAVTAAETAADPCAWAPTATVSPAVIPATPPGVPVVLDVAVTSTSAASCAPQSFALIIVDSGLLFDPRPPTPVGPGSAPGSAPAAIQLAGGATGHFRVTATAPASADPGDVFAVGFQLSDPSVVLPIPPPDPSGGPTQLPPPPGVVIPPLSFVVAGTPGCQVSTSHELMITDLSVVEDPVRTVFDPASRDPRNGAWTFKHLVENLARTPGDAPAMVEAMLGSFTAPQTINGFTVAARPGIQRLVLDTWPRTATGVLDLTRAPLRLLAIVNRLDLRDLDHGDAGEARFVFAFDLPPVPAAPPQQATIIFEYKLPAERERDVVGWAESFHLLGSLPFGDAYNAVLQVITERFVHRGARPSHPNGSAINAVRTNEIPFGDSPLWELREFHLSPRSGRLEPAALERTPDLGVNDTSTLAAYINANQAEIIAEQHTVPAQLAGQPFQAGAVFNDLSTWFATGTDSEARHHFAINTCNGCHAAQETGTVFLHLAPRLPGATSQRSRWLTGTIIDDPVTGQPRTFDDLGRRKADLKSIVCRGGATPPRDHLRKGIRRSH